MNSRIYLIAAALCMSAMVWAQKLKVESLEVMQTDNAAWHPNTRFVLENGQYCPLVKVVFADSRCTFEGNIPEERQPEFKTCEYWVWMNPQATHLVVKHKDLGKIDIIFSEVSNIKKLAPKTTYELKLTVAHYLGEKKFVSRDEPILDIPTREEIEAVSPWIDGIMIKGCYIFKKGDNAYFAVQPPLPSQRACNREVAHTDGKTSRQWGLADWRVPTKEEMEIILKNPPQNLITGNAYWCGNYSRQINVTSNQRTGEILRRDFLSYSSDCMTRVGKTITVGQPSFRAEYILVRDFDIECIPCPRTMFNETY